jgi:hypothetical protein
MTRHRIGLVGIALALIVGPSCGPGGDGDPNREQVVREGDRAPSFTLPSAQGREVSMEQFRGRRAVLLYFSMGPG